MKTDIDGEGFLEKSERQKEQLPNSEGEIPISSGGVGETSREIPISLEEIHI